MLIYTSMWIRSRCLQPTANADMHLPRNENTSWQNSEFKVKIQRKEVQFLPFWFEFVCSAVVLLSVTFCFINVMLLNMTIG